MMLLLTLIDSWMPSKTEKMGEPAFVDYRLFTLNNDMYLETGVITLIRETMIPIKIEIVFILLNTYHEFST